MNRTGVLFATTSATIRSIPSSGRAESNSIPTDLRRAATTREPEVAASIEVVAR